MNPAWVITGIILFGGMAAAGISLYVKKRKESRLYDPLGTGAGLGLKEPEKDER
jgi:hypothetical protein